MFAQLFLVTPIVVITSLHLWLILIGLLTLSSRFIDYEPIILLAVSKIPGIPAEGSFHGQIPGDVVQRALVQAYLLGALILAIGLGIVGAVRRRPVTITARHKWAVFLTLITVGSILFGGFIEGTWVTHLVSGSVLWFIGLTAGGIPLALLLGLRAAKNFVHSELT